VEGRRNWREKIRIQLNDNSSKGDERIWFHCSSLGEFEQGRPVIEKFKLQNYTSLTKYKIVLTFFSPSGYEIRKNYECADYVFYLPLDTPKNAEDFINLIQPKKVFFVKYDYWFHYLKALNKKNIPVYFISSVFRSDHRFFKWYGRFFKKMLSYVTHFFVQNEKSKQLLHSIGFDNATVCGDTRFDRVVQVAATFKEVELVKQFKNSKPLLIAGSTWLKDEEILVNLLTEPLLSDLKIAIVPHEILHHHIGALEYLLIEKGGLKPDEVAIYSRCEEESEIVRKRENEPSATSHFPTFSPAHFPYSARVLIIDTVGLLSSIYRYGDMAYVGGGFGTGIHNVLEAAVYGIPVFFGPKHQKFSEAIELINLGGAFSVLTSVELSFHIQRFLQDKNEKEKAATAAKNYVKQKAGATEKIFQYLNNG